jgi:hypothetical protein
MAEIDWEYVERIKREHDDYLARKARYTGSPYKSAVLPIHTSVDEEELAKVRKENEKLLKLVQHMYEDMCKILENTSKETPNYHLKSKYIQSIEYRIQEILDGK